MEIHIADRRHRVCQFSRIVLDQKRLSHRFVLFGVLRCLSGTIISFTNVKWLKLGRGLEGAVSKICVCVPSSGLSYVIAGLLKTGVGAIGVWMAMEIAFETVVECGGEAFVGCAG